MKNFKTEYELTPKHDGRKSFYHKAIVFIDENGDSYLRSYDTLVCAIIGGEFVKLWDGYSATTMRHVNEFAAQNGINGGGKAWWDSLGVA